MNNNQELGNQEQQRRGAQFTENQSQEPHVFEVKAQRSKLSKNEQGMQIYETQTHQTKLSKDAELGTHSFETQSYQAKISGKVDQEESRLSGQPIIQLPEEQQQPQEIHRQQEIREQRQEIREQPQEIREIREQRQEISQQPQEIQQQSQAINYPHDRQEAIQLPEQQQTIQSHEHEKYHLKEDKQLYEEKPREHHSHEKLHRDEYEKIHQESQLYGHQSPQLQEEKYQENQFQQQPQQQLEQEQFNQLEQPKVQRIQPQAAVIYEVRHPSTMQPQNIQGAQLPGAQMLQGVSPQTIQSGMSNLSASNTWTQPLPDAQGSVIGKANYNLEEAKRDAMSLFRAMKGAGTDKETIAEISGNRTFAQRQMIVNEYYRLGESERRDLLQDLKSEVGGDLESLILPLYMMPGEFDARLMEKAMYGLRNDVEVLIELLCTRTNKELQDMKKAWTERIDPKVRLEDKVAEETKTLFGVTNFHVLCLKLLEANRPPCATPDATQVRADAENLYQQLNTDDVTNAKAKFVEVFTERSWAHLGAVVGEFQKISDKWNMEKAISHEFGNSSNTTKALQVIAGFCAQPYDFWAKRLRDAMKGLGTDDSKVVRIVVSRCEVDMNNIVLVFGQRYGDGKNLKNWIDSDTSGAYDKLLSYLCGFR